ncbi:MAG: SDR family NAD(P)-dependent oxidoreductase, partial [Sphingomonas sp.]
ALNVNAPVALLGAFDPLLRRSGRGRIIGLTTKVAKTARAYWGEYAASKAAFEVMLRCYGDEVANLSPIRVALVDPGATRTVMRARAYPGEDPASVKDPQIVGDHIAKLIIGDFETGHYETID